MSDLTRQDLKGAAPRLSRDHRVSIGSMPSAPKGLWVSALIMVVVATGASWQTILTIRRVLLGTSYAGDWVDIVAVFLALASTVIVLPLVQGFKRCYDVRQAVIQKNIVSARVARSDATDKCWIAIGYSSAQLIAVFACLFLLANDQAVAKTFFFMPLIVKTFPLVLTAFWVNIKIFLISGVLVLICGLIVALMTFAPGPAGKPLRMIATAYIDIFRAIPAILVIYLVGFGLPLTDAPILRDLSLTTYVVLALTLTVSAYVAEVYRAGILSIPWSQTAAARSLGLSHMKTLRFVVVPQGVRYIIPPLLNALIALQKDTALVNVVGVIDSFNQSMLVAANYYNLSAVTTVAFLFLAISIPQTRLVERLMQRDRARMRAGTD